MEKRNSHEQRVTRGAVRAFRHQQGWSAIELGRELSGGIGSGYSRSYIKSIEGGSLPVSRFFREKFLRVVERVRGEQVNSKQILMRGRFPKRLVISGRPRRCDVCGWPFIGSTPSQKRCGPKCAKLARALTAKGKKP